MSICSRCDFKMAKGMLKCPKCGKYNLGSPAVATSTDGNIVIAGVQILSEVEETENTYISTGPWDPCFGTGENGTMGLVKGCVYILAGMPGAGKSTLSLQLADTLAHSLGKNVCYIGAEERLKEIKSRGKRLGLQHMNMIHGISALGGLQQDLGTVLLALRPAGIVLDSIRGLSLESLDEEVEYCKALKGYAVEIDCPIIAIMHATKQDDVAGNLGLQHAGDCTCVLYVNDDGGQGVEPTRTLTSIKNRLGPLRDVHLMMTNEGLVELPKKNEVEEEEEEEEEGNE